MDVQYKCLFTELEFSQKRNAIFGEFYSKLEQFLKETKNKSLNNLPELYSEYVYKKGEHISVQHFVFKNENLKIQFFDVRKSKYKFYFERLKKVDIYPKENSLDTDKPIEEWIFDENYLKYLLKEIHKMKNPKFAHNINSIKEDSSVVSLNDSSIVDFMKGDWNVVYESPKSIDYDKIKRSKNKEKKEDELFLELIGLKKENISERNNVSSLLPCSFVDGTFKEKSIFFHNEDKYFTFNILQDLDNKYNWGILGYLYINFEFLRKVNRQKRLELFAYSLLSLFPQNFELFQNFFENNIKNLLTDKINCLKEIIREIIYFFNNYFSKDEQKDSNKGNNEEESKKDNNDNTELNLFNNVKQKNFFIIFDNITNNDDDNLIDKIIDNHPSTDIKFKFIKIYPLINDYSFNKFLKCYNGQTSHTIFFANLNNYCNNEDNNNNNSNEKKLNIFNENNKKNEELLYDLIRIYYFKEIFVDSKNEEENSKSLGFLKNYFYYFNIEFDNKINKLSHIYFKKKVIEEEFNKKYANIFNLT